MNLQSSYRNHLIEPGLGTRNQIAGHFYGTLDCEIEADNHTIKWQLSRRLKNL